MLLLAIGGLAGCANSPDNGQIPLHVRPANVSGAPSSPVGSTGAGGFSESDLGGDPGRYRIYDKTEEQIDPQRVDAFLRLRCLTLGRHLVLLSSEDAQVAELARGRVQDLIRGDLRRIRETVEAGQPASRTAGLVIPRYIMAKLEGKEPSEWDLRWLRIQGELLQLTYEFEQYDRQRWEVAIGRMMQFGKEGREYLAAQMVVRMRISDGQFRDYAKDVLVNFVPDEAIDPLVAGTYVEIANQFGVFPKQCASVLAEIGPKAVPGILLVFKGDDGKHIPADDVNWVIRRYLVPALGSIGSVDALDTLIAELDTMQFATETRRMYYAAMIVDALARIGDKRAVKAIVREWKVYQDPVDFMMEARPALFRLTRQIYSHPDEVPLE